MGFILIVLVASSLLHGWIWFRAVRSTTGPGRTRRVLSAVVTVLAVLPVLAVAAQDFLPFSAQGAVDWVGFTWLGFAFYLFLSLVILEPARWVLTAMFARSAAPPARPAAELIPQTTSDDSVTQPAAQTSRRLFLARSIAVTAGAAAASTGSYGLWAANTTPRVERLTVQIAGLPPELSGYRIVTFSDGHLSATYGGSRFAKVVDTVNAQHPDVVTIVGDLVDGSLRDLRDDAAPLGDLVSREGAFFVTGNHEYIVEDTEQWLRHLPTLGVQVLRNERVSLGRDGAAFDLAGIDDRTAAASGLPGHGADLDAALDGRDDNRPVVLLAHQPVQVAQAVAAGVDLQISGHTHGGQLWPFDYAVLLDQPASKGLSRYGTTQLYVTAGAGYWGPPMRVGARPEVTVIELSPTLT